jgi:hypothetical protein
VSCRGVRVRASQIAAGLLKITKRMWPNKSFVWKKSAERKEFTLCAPQVLQQRLILVNSGKNCIPDNKNKRCFGACLNTKNLFAHILFYCFSHVKGLI